MSHISRFLTVRQSVVFDANNAKHRKFYHEFVKTKAWGSCPIQWLIDDESIDVVHNINNKLIEFYLHREFKNSTI